MILFEFCILYGIKGERRMVFVLNIMKMAQRETCIFKLLEGVCTVLPSV